jgi:hypothetical protein
VTEKPCIYAGTDSKLDYFWRVDCPDETLHREIPSLAAMQRGYEDDLVAVLQLIVAFALELPVRVVNENEDTRSTREH